MSSEYNYSYPQKRKKRKHKRKEKKKHPYKKGGRQRSMDIKKKGLSELKSIIELIFFGIGMLALLLLIFVFFFPNKLKLAEMIINSGNSIMWIGSLVVVSVILLVRFLLVFSKARREMK